jgi:hypothetical protein
MRRATLVAWASAAVGCGAAATPGPRDEPAGEEGDAEATHGASAKAYAERVARDGAKAAVEGSTRLFRAAQDASVSVIPTRESVEASGREAVAWLAGATASQRDSVAAWLADAPPELAVSLEVASVLVGAIETDFEITPIVRKVEGPEDEAEIDRAIGALPSVEVTDGLKIGFQRMTKTDVDVDESKQAYLITWRDGDQVVGLVLKTRRAIDLEELRAEIPRLVRLVKGVM